MVYFGWSRDRIFLDWSEAGSSSSKNDKSNNSSYEKKHAEDDQSDLPASKSLVGLSRAAECPRGKATGAGIAKAELLASIQVEGNTWCSIGGNASTEKWIWIRSFNKNKMLPKMLKILLLIVINRYASLYIFAQVNSWLAMKMSHPKLTWHRRMSKRRSCNHRS